MTNHLTRLGVATFAAAFAFALDAQPASAQARADNRWEAWIGCWTPASVAAANDPASPLLCVSPTKSPSAVEVASIEKGAVVSRDTIDASGATRTTSKQGCTGTEAARWSTDGRRVFLHSEVACTEGMKRTTNHILSIAPGEEWLDVQSITVAGNTAVRTTRYRDATSLREIPAEFARLNADRALAVSTARGVASGSLDVASVAEAVQRSDSTAVAAWIVERGTAFTNLDARQLLALANAGVPGSVTDVMVGVSYPEHFALDRRPMPAAKNALSSRDSARIASDYFRDRCMAASIWSSLYDPQCSYAYGAYGYGYYDSYYNRYSPYGYYGGYYSPFYSGPVVIVRGDQQQSHGQVVKGRGYSCGSCGGDGGSAPRSSSGSSSGSSGSSSSGGSGGSSGGSSSSGSSSSGGSSSGGRTAHPRPPV